MNNLLQPGHHPDAEQLSAFTDHALPPHEQQQMLAHLNVCRDCRNRVYLGQQINPAASPQSTSAALPHSMFAGWFSGWRLAFPVAAFACFILLAIYLRRAPGPRTQPTPDNSASNTPAQPQLAAAPVQPSAAPAPPVSASPKSRPIPRGKRTQPVNSEQVAASAAAPPSAPLAQDTPGSFRPLRSAIASAGVKGIGGISGIVSDPDGRAVAKATVIATNTDTGVQTSALTGNGGKYTIEPLQPGPYNVEVVARGFERVLQENVTVEDASVVGLPLKLPVGGESTTVTVTDAPPMLETADATLGGTIENELYTSLPLSMNGGPRNPAAFQYLMPGVQENPANNRGAGASNGNSGIYGGSGASNLNENYLEGMSASHLSAPSTLAVRARTARIKPLPILPSRLAALSVADHAGRTLAIDTAGTLFSSEDAGVTWHPVPIQWQGRALTIRVAASSPAPQATAAANSAGAAQSQAIGASFELATDSGARYSSPDGQIWHRK